MTPVRSRTGRSTRTVDFHAHLAKAVAMETPNAGAAFNQHRQGVPVRRTARAEFQAHLAKAVAMEAPNAGAVFEANRLGNWNVD
ncbi:hypothetical protein ABT095_29010 [Kitasatospora sp. NPDC002227]|uniref:hypothetical protein n=1 Tax=Kitasatospora sp. NPDC002227 TaxID=3154773 RepID=UPI00332B7BAA